MNNLIEVKAIRVGGLARKAFSTGSHGTVLGVTSSGIFLNFNDKILFLTNANYHSPYNIQVISIGQLSSTVIVGDQCRVDGDIVTFERINYCVDIEPAQIWYPASLERIDNPKAIQIERLKVLLHRFCELDLGKGWLFLVDCEGRSSADQDSEIKRIRQITDNFLSSVQKTDKSACLESSRSILGLGGGLTPSGDDWLTGFFLFFARLKHQDPFLIDLGVSITAMAFGRTTKISANRIEAACQGWAEEMFLEVIDHLLVSSTGFSDEKVIRLANFGHSSGVDTCMGIKAALSLK